MSYVVKVGEYYVKSIDVDGIKLSIEVMGTFPKSVAVMVAKKLNGRVEEFKDVETMDYEQLSLFDKEVTNA